MSEFTDRASFKLLCMKQMTTAVATKSRIQLRCHESSELPAAVTFSYLSS